MFLNFCEDDKKMGSFTDQPLVEVYSWPYGFTFREDDQDGGYLQIKTIITVVIG